MAALVCYVLIMWVCAGAGARVLKWLRAGDITLAEELPFAAAIGMGILSYLILAVGLLHQLRVWAALLLLAVLVLIGWREMLRLARHLPARLSALRVWRRRLLPITIFLLALFLLTLIGALAPAGNSDYDSLVYHLAIPKAYVRAGGIHFVPWLSHSNFPFTLEMLYTLGLLLDGQLLAKLFHFGCGWLTVLAVFGFARRWWGSLAGWLGAAVLAAIPLVSWQMMTAYVELAFALYAFLALAALARARLEPEEAKVESRESRVETTLESRISTLGRYGGWLWVAALMCGWALGVKMLGGAVLIFALAALLWGLRAAPDRRRSARHIVWFALIAIALAVPWYLKSYMWTGNPVYPFFYGLFDGRFWTADRARSYTEAQKAFGMGGGSLAFLLLPWNLTMHPHRFFDQPNVLQEFNVYVWVFGPLLLALIPTLALTGRVGGAGRLALWFALLFAAAWFLLTHNGRYLIPILPGLSACAGLAAARLLRQKRLVFLAAMLALILGLLAGLLPAALLAAPAARVAVGLESQAEYLAPRSRTYRVFKQVEQATLPSARVMLLGGEPRTFYLDRDCLLGDHAEIFSQADLASARAFLTALERMGVTHLLLGASIVQNMQLRSGLLETRLYELAVEGHIKLIGAFDSFTLWQVEGEQKASDR
jgi:4-amino-4-deoxy-L-arabinose transferase-like glycosyltransferase